MLIVVQGDGQEREVAVDLHADDACARDLMAALGLVGDGITVDGRFVPAAAPLGAAGLVDGALVTPGPPAADPPAPQSDAWLTVVAGTRAGRRFPLVAGRAHQIGRRPDLDVRLDDPTVSAHHATVTVAPDGTATITDSGSRNGTWVDGAALTAPRILTAGTVVRCGAMMLRLDGPDPDDAPRTAAATAGRVPFNRPPRPAPPPPVGPLELPPPPPDPTPAARLNLVAVLAPLVAAAGMVVLSGNPRFALFVLLSPVMAVGTWLSSRRAARRSRRDGTAAAAAALARFRRDLDAQQQAEVRRREETLPDLAELLRRATTPSVRLWERRRDHDDALRLRLGSVDLPWDPSVTAGRDGTAPEVHAALREAGLPAASVALDLSRDPVVGIVGAREAALATAWSLVVQAAVLHGPADLEVVVCADRPDDWDWVVWLPHVRTAGTWSLAGTPAEATALLHGLLDRDGSSTTAPTRLVVLDDEALLAGRGAPARRVLQGEAGPVAGIVLAATEDALPAFCATVVTVDDGPPATATVWRPWERQRLADVLVAGLAADDARRAARALARFEDPEAGGGGALPASVRLVSQLGTPVTPDGIAATWQDARPAPAPSTPIGVAADGPVVLDLRRDGPHALIGGTTGAGKSELLRSLVAGLAARLDPDHLVFVLVDYKGGSAFDEAARLPHVVGLVTDLDDHLGERALTSLEAELRHRERLLRAAGAADLDAYLAAGAPHGPLPRLVVVIDEFATLAAELPDFLAALVGIARRGRSLGLHLVLATQRPQGAVDAAITANTNLRIALRFQAASDSTHLIDVPDAAHLDRATPGRALVRRGAGDLVLVQTALVTGRTGAAATPVTVTPVRFGPGRAGGTGNGGADADAPTDLTRIVAACRAAFETSGQAPPRRPWLPMLPADLPLAAVLDGAPPDDGTAVPFGLVDRPDEQAQVPTTWDPARGHLAVFGMVGAGVTSTLVTIAQSLATRRSPAACHLYALDHGDGGLAGLAALPHTGAVVGPAERERRLRLLAHLEREIHRRRDLAPAVRADEPRIVLLVDGIGGLLADQGGVEGLEFTEALARVLADGPAVGIAAVLGGDRPAALPQRLAGNVAQRLCLKLADPAELGLRRPPRLVPGRGVLADGHHVVQVGRPHDPDEVAAKVAARWSVAPARPPVPITSLPARVAVVELPAPSVTGDVVRLPIGVGDLLGAGGTGDGGAGGGGTVGVLGPAVLDLRPGEPVLVAGPPRSGRTTTLQLLSAQLRVARPDAIQVGICAPRSGLHGYPSLDGSGAPDAFAAVLDRPAGRLLVVLVDDAPQISGDQLAELVGRPEVLLVASARPADLRGNYGHWTRGLRAARTGLLLTPDVTVDGDLLSVRLPRRPVVPLGRPGRGVLVQDGATAVTQVALPPTDPPRGSLG